MSVRIRMKKFGRRHRPFYRICAIDRAAPRNARVIEELGTYDPLVPETDARAILNRERIQYWLSVGAEPSDKVGVLIKKYGPPAGRTSKSSRPRWSGSPGAATAPRRSPSGPPRPRNLPPSRATGDAPCASTS